MFAALFCWAPSTIHNTNIVHNAFYQTATTSRFELTSRCKQHFYRVCVCVCARDPQMFDTQRDSIFDHHKNTAPNRARITRSCLPGLDIKPSKTNDSTLAYYVGTIGS